MCNNNITIEYMYNNNITIEFTYDTNTTTENLCITPKYLFMILRLQYFTRFTLALQQHTSIQLYGRRLNKQNNIYIFFRKRRYRNIVYFVVGYTLY